MKKLLFIFALAILCVGCDKKDGPHNGAFPPQLFIILNNMEGNSLLPAIPAEHSIISLTNYEATFEVNGENIGKDTGEEDGLRLSIKKEEDIGKEVRSLAAFSDKVSSFLFLQAGKDNKYSCQVKITLKCKDIFKTENEHTIEMKMKYCGDKRNEMMEAVKNSVYVDGVQAECLKADLYKVNLNIK